MKMEASCTACGKIIDPTELDEFCSHPRLTVLICKQCYDFYGDGNFSQHESGDNRCRWCADGGRLIMCDSCTNAFCTKCIRRNLGRKELHAISNIDQWRCFCCDASKLKPFRKEYRNIMKNIDFLKRKIDTKPDLTAIEDHNRARFWVDELFRKTEEILNCTREQMASLKNNLKKSSCTDNALSYNYAKKLHVLLTRHSDKAKYLLLTFKNSLLKHAHEKGEPTIKVDETNATQCGEQDVIVKLEDDDIIIIEENEIDDRKTYNIEATVKFKKDLIGAKKINPVQVENNDETVNLDAIAKLEKDASCGGADLDDTVSLVNDNQKQNATLRLHESDPTKSGSVDSAIFKLEETQLAERIRRSKKRALPLPKKQNQLGSIKKRKRAENGVSSYVLHDMQYGQHDVSNKLENDVTSEEINSVQLENNSVHPKTNDTVYNAKLEQDKGCGTVDLNDTISLENYHEKQNATSSSCNSSSKIKTNFVEVVMSDKATDADSGSSELKKMHFDQEKICLKGCVPCLIYPGEQLNAQDSLKAENYSGYCVPSYNESPKENSSPPAKEKKENNIDLNLESSFNVKLKQPNPPEISVSPAKKIKLSNQSIIPGESDFSANYSSADFHLEGKTSGPKPVEVPDQKQNCKLFVSRLNMITTEVSLRIHFMQWGQIVDCLVLRHADTKKSRGVGFVTYKEPLMARSALNCVPHVVDGCLLDVKSAVSQMNVKKLKDIALKSKLFIGNLPVSAKEDDLLNYFSRYGQVLDVSIASDRGTGMRRGFAFVQFDSSKTVDFVMSEQQQHILKGNKLDVKRALTRDEIQHTKLVSDSSECHKDTDPIFGTFNTNNYCDSFGANQTQNKDSSVDVQTMSVKSDPLRGFQSHISEYPQPFLGQSLPAARSEYISAFVEGHRPFITPAGCQQPFVQNRAAFFPGQYPYMNGFGPPLRALGPSIGGLAWFTGRQTPGSTGCGRFVGYQPHIAQYRYLGQNQLADKQFMHYGMQPF